MRTPRTRTPFRHFLPATFYGDQLRADAPPGPADVTLLQTLYELLTSGPIAPAGAGPKKAGRRPLRPPFNTLEELRQAPLEFRKTYSAARLDERHGFSPHSAVRHDQLSTEALAA